MIWASDGVLDDYLFLFIIFLKKIGQSFYATCLGTWFMVSDKNTSQCQCFMFTRL